MLPRSKQTPFKAMRRPVSHALVAVESGGRGHVAGEGGEGEVEGTVGFAGEGEGLGEDAGEVGGRGGGLGLAELVEIAFEILVGEGAVDGGDALEGGAGGGGVEGVEEDADEGAHVGLDGFLAGSLRGCVGREQRGEKGEKPGAILRPRHCSSM